MIDSKVLSENGNIVIEDERNLSLLKLWAQASQVNSTKTFVQLNHPGRQAPKYFDADPIAPSAAALVVLKFMLHMDIYLVSSYLQFLIFALINMVARLIIEYALLQKSIRQLEQKLDQIFQLL